jgi:hypothetical protein
MPATTIGKVNRKISAVFKSKYEFTFRISKKENGKNIIDNEQLPPYCM